jgi:hypothetical protein
MATGRAGSAALRDDIIGALSAQRLEGNSEEASEDRNPTDGIDQLRNLGLSTLTIIEGREGNTIAVLLMSLDTTQVGIPVQHRSISPMAWSRCILRGR